MGFDRLSPNGKAKHASDLLTKRGERPCALSWIGLCPQQQREQHASLQRRQTAGVDRAAFGEVQFRADHLVGFLQQNSGTGAWRENHGEAG